jgi:GST-like protein
MIEFYYQPSPNTWKVAVMLEECELAYTVKPINILAGEQNAPAFLKINPNNKIPAIVDLDAPSGPLAMFESGAILVYLAEKTGKFLPAVGSGRYDVLQWLFWQMAGLGPMAGQAHVFRSAKEQIPFAIERYRNECARLYRVMDTRLADRDYLAVEFSIADIACFGWVWFHNMHSQSLADFPNVARWFDLMSTRNGVSRGKALGLDTLPEQYQKMMRGKEWTPG